MLSDRESSPGRLGSAVQGRGKQQTDLVRAGAEQLQVNRLRSGILGQLGRRGRKQQAVLGRECGAICSEPPGAGSGSPIGICDPSLLHPKLISLVFSSHRPLLKPTCFHSFLLGFSLRL